jgi:hypothetical protein
MDWSESGVHSPGKLIEHAEKFASKIGRHEVNLQGKVCEVERSSFHSCCDALAESSGFT